MASTTRTETDSFGEVVVPSDKLWGAQTQRSLQNFKIGNQKMPIKLVRSYAILKKCCAKMNFSQGKISEEISNAIIKASEEVIAGDLDAHFPLVKRSTICFCA